MGIGNALRSADISKGEQRVWGTLGMPAWPKRHIGQSQLNSDAAVRPGECAATVNYRFNTLMAYPGGIDRADLLRRAGGEGRRGTWLKGGEYGGITDQG